MHPKAVKICKKLNARLPLPRNEKEAKEFLKISPSFTHVDARNPKKTSNKAEWVDAEGKPFGSRPVYLWGHKVTITSYHAFAENLSMLYKFRRLVHMTVTRPLFDTTPNL